MGQSNNYFMENAKKIIIVFVLILFSCKENTKFKFLKENLYSNKDGQIFMKLSNKNPINPSLEDSWKDTIYIQYFYFNYDSLININDIINKKEFKTIIPDEEYNDGKYIYTSKYYTPGKRMNTVRLID